MAKTGCLQAVMNLVQCVVMVLLSQLVIPAHGQTARVAADIQTMLNVREELFEIPKNKMILEDWNVESYPCNWTRVECEGVGSSASVRRIDLNQRNLSGPVPPSIGNLLSLTYITADGNMFDSIPPNFFKAKQLKFISFRNNLISGNVLDRLTAFQSLRVLLFGQNLLSGRIDSLSRLNRSAVQAIDLAGNRMQGNLSTLSGFANLASLRLGKNQLTGGLGAIGTLTSMYDLSLEENNFTGSIPLSTLSGMISVNLSRNLLQGTFTLNDIFVPGTIKSLDLSENRLTQVVPEFLDSRNLSAESTLDFFWARGVSKILLGGNGLAGSIVSFPESASTLNLSHNLLSGDLPPADKATFYEAMETLLLNNNSFTGAIPTGFWKMVNAVTMDLSRNQFSGTLPGGGAFFMPSLQTLNLSWNSLSGPIPADISNMTRNFNLRTVDLSFNNFRGPLPSGLPQGDNYSYSFIGNPGLCSDDEFFRRAHLLVRCSKPSKAVQAIWAGVGSTLVVVLILVSALLVLWRKQVIKDNRMDADLVKAVSHGLISTRLIPLRQLRKATSNFAEDAKIGEGGFGSVYRGYLEGKEVAIKKSSNAILQLVASKQMFMNEVQIMSSVNHRYLISLLGCCMTTKSALLVFEYVPQGTLAEHLYCRRGQGLDWNQRLKIARQTAEALSYLHFTADPPIYHRDVKSANILLDDQLNAKVADFGISKLAPNLDTTQYSTLAVQGTPGYIDPEYYVSYQMTGKSDVYSFGVVLLELITSRAPLDYRRGERDSTLVKMATHLVRTDALHLLVDPMLMIVFDDEEEVKKSILSVAELALRCVDRNPDDRPDMQQVAIEIEALSSVHYHVHKVEEDDMEVIPIANPVARRQMVSYESATTGAGSMEFQSPFGRCPAAPVASSLSVSKQ